MRIEVEQMQAGRIDLTELGDQLLRAVLVAVQLGHTSPQESLIYTHPTSLEGRFVHQLLRSMDRDEEESFAQFLEDWFGGEDGARLILKRMANPNYVYPAERAGV